MMTVVFGNVEELPSIYGDFGDDSIEFTVRVNA